jgi:branched-chain amino acid transport system substrate-binding protein
MPGDPIRGGECMKLTKVGAIAGVAVLALAACGGSNAAKGTVKIAIDLPLQGSELAASQPIINGVKLALKDAGGSVGGYTVEVPQAAIYDDAINGAHDPQTGAANATKMAGDDAIIGVVGPLNSSVGKAMIPITNEAGLLQCSPANTNPDLTKGDPAAQLRTKPNNYIRVTTTDDVQGPAASQYLYDVLGKKNVYIIDDTETFGKGVADAFEADFEQRGGPEDHAGLRLDHDGGQGPQP